jgi:hypothetical protein
MTQFALGYSERIRGRLPVRRKPKGEKGGKEAKHYFQIKSPIILLPKSCIKPWLVGASLCMGSTYTEAHTLIEHYSAFANENPFTKYATTFKKVPFFGITKGLVKDLEELLSKSMRVRIAFKNLLRIWIAKRVMKQASDVDVVTLDPPQKPVSVWDWKSRKIYTFEARTILIDIQRRILTHEGLFPVSKLPRNPYTNLELTVGQLFHCYEQLKGYQLTHWTLEQLRVANFSWFDFLNAQATSLRMAALKSIYKDQTSEDFRAYVLDFIEAEHENNGIHCASLTYAWALIHRPEDTLVQKWKNLCYKFYHYSIIYRDSPLKESLLEKVVYAVAKKYCGQPVHLIAERRIWLRAQSRV